MSTPKARVSRGTPAGGEFKAIVNGEATGSLVPGSNSDATNRVLVQLLAGGAAADAERLASCLESAAAEIRVHAAGFRDIATSPVSQAAVHTSNKIISRVQSAFYQLPITKLSETAAMLDQAIAEAAITADPRDQ